VVNAMAVPIEGLPKTAALKRRDFRLHSRAQSSSWRKALIHVQLLSNAWDLLILHQDFIPIYPALIDIINIIVNHKHPRLG
jgi:hypothetical protein